MCARRAAPLPPPAVILAGSLPMLVLVSIDQTQLVEDWPAFTGRADTGSYAPLKINSALDLRNVSLSPPALTLSETRQLTVSL